MREASLPRQPARSWCRGPAECATAHSATRLVASGCCVLESTRPSTTKYPRAPAGLRLGPQGVRLRLPDTESLTRAPCPNNQIVTVSGRRRSSVRAPADTSSSTSWHWPVSGNFNTATVTGKQQQAPVAGSITLADSDPGRRSTGSSNSSHTQ